MVRPLPNSRDLKQWLITNHGWFLLGCVCADLHRAVFEGELRTVRDILHVLSEPAFSHIIDVNAEDMAGLTPLVLLLLPTLASIHSSPSSPQHHTNRWSSIHW